MLAQSLAALDASSGNPTNDASLPQVGSASLEVVAFVGVQFQWSSTGGVLAGQQSQELRPRTSRTSWSRAQDRQRNASGIYDDMPLGAELASVRWVRACFLAPGGLVPRSHQCWPGSNQSGHVHASETAWPGATAPRRQQVLPLPYPRDWGRSSQGMPVCRTNKMPLKGASLLTASLRAPPLAEGTKAEIRGCSCCHSSLLTGRRAMRTTSITALRGPLTKWC